LTLENSDTSFEQLNQYGVWDKILELTLKKLREKKGKAPDPTSGVIDSQTVKWVFGGEERGYDGNKKIKCQETQHYR